MDRETLLQKLREREEFLADKEICSEPEPEEDQAEEVQHHTFCLPACKLPGIFHAILIPWYTTGFR